MRQKGVLQISNPTANVTFSISGLAVYGITPTLTNCTAQAGNPTTIEQGGTTQLTFLFDGTNYKCPTTAPTVTNATGTWVKVSDTKGNLTLSNPSGAVSFSVVGEVIQSGYTVTYTSDEYYHTDWAAGIDVSSDDDGFTVYGSFAGSGGEWPEGTLTNVTSLTFEGLDIGHSAQSGDPAGYFELNGVRTDIKVGQSVTIPITQNSTLSVTVEAES